MKVIRGVRRLPGTHQASLLEGCRGAARIAGGGSCGGGSHCPLDLLGCRSAAHLALHALHFRGTVAEAPSPDQFRRKYFLFYFFG